MKRTFRVAIILIPVAVLLAGIGLWRNHYLKIMNAEPVKVYKVRPSDTNTPKVTSVKGDDNTDVTDVEPSITTQRIDNSITPEKMDNTSNSPAGTIFGDIAEQNLPPEAAAALKEYAAALKEYEEAQSALLGLNNELKPLLEAIPLDMDAIRLVTEKKRKLKQQRMDALEILALYSDEAFNELQATIERKKTTERMVYGLDDSLSAKKSTAKLNAKLKRTSEKLNEIRKSISIMSEKKKELDRLMKKMKN